MNPTFKIKPKIKKHQGFAPQLSDSVNSYLESRGDRGKLLHG